MLRLRLALGTMAVGIVLGISLHDPIVAALAGIAFGYLLCLVIAHPSD